MPKKSFSEWLLRRFADQDRASAIFGDLVEMEKVRGALWFWTAYARTLISLGWRAPVAFLGSIVSVRIMFGTVFPWWFQHAMRSLSGEWQVDMPYARIAVGISPLLTAVGMCLWFALPYILIRFGLHDRLTQFAFAVFLITFPVFSYRPWVIDLCGVLTIFTIVGAILSPLWRRPLAVLAITAITAVTAITGSFRILAAMFYDVNFRTFAPSKAIGWLNTALELSIAAFVCSRLHDRLLSPRIAGGQDV